MVRLEETDMHGQVAIVTGAGKGLGRAFALHLAGQGVRVVVNNRKHAADGDFGSADKVVREIEALGGTAVASYTPAEQPESGAQLMEQALDTYGRLDIIVPNAAITSELSLHKMSLEHFRTVMDINFFGSLYLAHAAVPHMRQSGYGRIVFIISTAGLYGGHGLAAYAASKAALIGLMHSIAAENLKHGVRANALAPYAATQMTGDAIPEALAALLTPARVAPALGWLAHPSCSASAEIFVSGGGYIRRAGMREGIGQMMADPGSTGADDLETLYPELQDSTNLLSFSGAGAEFMDLARRLTAELATDGQMAD